MERLDSIEIFRAILKDLTEKNIDIIIRFDPNCKYDAYVDFKNGGNIICRSTPETGVLLEEFIHKFQNANHKMAMQDNEFEAKCILSVLINDNTINAPQVWTNKDKNKTFWNSFYKYVENPSDANFNTAKSSLYFVYDIKDYKKITTGKELPNFHILLN